jgi:hypothetical protein
MVEYIIILQNSLSTNGQRLQVKTIIVILQRKKGFSKLNNIFNHKFHFKYIIQSNHICVQARSRAKKSQFTNTKYHSNGMVPWDVPLKVRPSSFRLNSAAVHEDAAFSCL